MSHVQVPAIFYLVGCSVYNYLEGWSPLDTVYFLTVTSTTVGYGDLSPASSLGKLFTCIYALIGITVILGSLAPLVAFLRGDWREKLLGCLGMGQVCTCMHARMHVRQLLDSPGASAVGRYVHARICIPLGRLSMSTTRPSRWMRSTSL